MLAISEHRVQGRRQGSTVAVSMQPRSQHWGRLADVSADETLRRRVFGHAGWEAEILLASHVSLWQGAS